MPDLKLTKFSGPLDLLLQLIDHQELDITEISLSEVTEQYFQYLDKLERNRSEKLADFLVIAAKLIYLKSKYLLPHLYTEEELEGESLAYQLKLYKAYVEASKNIEELWNQGKVAYGRVEPPIKMKEFTIPANAYQDELLEAMQTLLKRIKPIKPLPEATIDHSISVKHTVDKIRNMLMDGKKINFNKLVSDVRNRSEVIVNFLAVLELVGKSSIMISQTSSYSEFEIHKV